MAVFTPKKATSQDIDNLVDGVLAVTTDTKEAHIKLGGELISISGVIVLSSDTERLAVTSPLSNKLYVVCDKLWRWDGSWVCLNEEVDLTGVVKAIRDGSVQPCYPLDDDLVGYLSSVGDTVRNLYEVEGGTSFSLKLDVETGGTLELLLDSNVTKTLNVEAGEAWYSLVNLAGFGVDGVVTVERTGGTSAGVTVLELGKICETEVDDVLTRFAVENSDVLYAIDAKAGNGRLLSPIQGKLSLLDQDLTASTFEEKQGYLKNESGIIITEGYWQPQSYARVLTPIDLRGRDTSFTVICKGVLVFDYSAPLFAQAEEWYYGTGHVTNVVKTSNGICFSVTFADGLGDIVKVYYVSSSTLANMTEEMLYALVCDLEKRKLSLYINGNLDAEVDIPDTAVCVNNNTEAYAANYDNLGLFGGGTAHITAGTISYFAFVDRAMTAEEVAELGGA